MEAARFFIVASIGLALDLAIAWSAAEFFDLPLWIAAAIGFIIAAMANYALHELWTFRSAARSLSAARAVRYSFTLGITLGIRIGSVAALAVIFGDAHTLTVLTGAALASFCIHYLISKHFVFSTIQE
jgi:putative flippase GtrA